VINLKRLLKTLRNKGKTALREAFAELLHQLSGTLFTRLATAPSGYTILSRPAVSPMAKPSNRVYVSTAPLRAGR